MSRLRCIEEGPGLAFCGSTLLEGERWWANLEVAETRPRDTCTRCLAMARREVSRIQVHRNGTEAQMRQVMEEAAELIVAANKMLRANASAAKWRQDGPLARMAVAEEVADVEIVLDQVRALVGDKAVNMAKASKIQRIKSGSGYREAEDLVRRRGPAEPLELDPEGLEAIRSRPEDETKPIRVRRRDGGRS